MGWIVGVGGMGGAALSLVEAEAEADGTRAIFAMDALLDAHVAHGKRRTRFITIDLADFTRLDMRQAAAFAQSAGIPLAVVQAQSLYSVEHASRKVIVPSQVLVHAFVGSTRAHRSALLSPAGFQLLACLTVNDGELGVTYPSHFEKKSPERSGGLTQTILWTGAYPSARRMHSSVLRHALEGRFDIDLPKAKATMSFMGAYLDNGTMLATRITLAVVEPLEPPMAHAVGVVKPKFEFAVVGQRRLVKGTVNTGPRGPKGSGLEVELADAPYAAALGDEEWEQVRSSLLRHRSYDRQLGAREREKVDLILRKLSTGLPWTQVAGSVSRAQLVQRFFKDLEDNGGWAEVKRYLLAARGGDRRERGYGSGHPRKGAQPDDALDLDSTQILFVRQKMARMTQVEFAELLGVSSRTITDWERGIRSPKGAAARRLRIVATQGVGALEFESTGIPAPR